MWITHEEVFDGPAIAFSVEGSVSSSAGRTKGENFLVTPIDPIWVDAEDGEWSGPNGVAMESMLIEIESPETKAHGPRTKIEEEGLMRGIFA